jgi:prophage regulatory protein
MRIIGWKELRRMQPYSRQHIARLEKADLFPKRVQLGQNRVGWVYDEVVAHLKQLASLRDTADTPA